MQRHWLKFVCASVLSALLTVTQPWSVVAQLSSFSGLEFTDPQPVIEFVPIKQEEAVDFLNPDKTPLLQSVATCLPPRSPSSLVPRFSWLISWVDDAGVTYHYINVYRQYESGPPAEPSATLIQATASGNCKNLLSAFAMESLTRYLPKSVAIEFAKTRNKQLKVQFPDFFNETVRAYATGGSLFTEPDGRAPFGSPMDDPRGCEVFVEDAAALKQMGYTVSDRCRVLQ